METTRLNIGLLISELEDAYTRSVCEGAISASKELQANIFIFPGKYINANYNDVYRTRYDYQHNSVFDYAKTCKLDVLFVCMGTIASNIDMDEKIRFLKNFDGIPVISISERIPGFPFVTFDNMSGFKDGILHLIDVHGCRNIGFVSGPETSADANERLQAFCEVMKYKHLPLTDKQIVYGNFSEYSQEIVRELLANNKDLDAIVFANDMMASGAYEVFKEQGIKVGEDLAVIGFDNAPRATTMEPRLSTVKADALELGYRAIISFPDIISGRIQNLIIKSEFVIRDSCGCNKTKTLKLRLSQDDFSKDADSSAVLEKINVFLFGENSIQAGSERIKTKVAEYYFYVKKHMMSGELTDEKLDSMGKIMRGITRLRLTPYTNMDCVFALFECTYHLILQQVGEENKRKLTELFFEVLKDVAGYIKKRYDSKEDDAFWLNAIATTFTRDILNFATDDDRAYESIVDKLSQLYFKSAYICMMDQYIVRQKDDPTQIPQYMWIKVFLKDKAVHYVREDKQRVLVDGLINRLFEDHQERATVMVQLLFSMNEQYGLFISEIDEEHLNYVLPVTYQISSAVKTIDLLRSKEIITAQLEKSLEQIKETNAILDELSKSDPLTQIYNRRGFLTTAQHQMLHAEHIGQKAAVIFADMNNLKIVNDQFGHEEGDYSLKMLAEILKQAFPKGIIGRYGGDEFVAFTMMQENSSKEKIRDMITEITKQYNAATDKPYYFSMSVGVCEFYCKEDIRIQDVLDKADVDLYLEKKHKRNNILK